MARKPRRPAVDFAAYLVIRLVVCIAHALPPGVTFWFSDRIAWAVHRFVPSRRRVAMENVALAYPELAANPIAIDRLVRAMYRHLIRSLAEAILLPRKLHLTTWRKFVDLSRAHAMFGPMYGSRPALIVTAHFGNWEMTGYLFGRFGLRTHAIARVLDNPYLERFVLRFRQATGQTIVAKKDDFDRLTSVLRAGGKVSTLADQDAGARGVFVEFFGRPASTHKAVALMAMEFDAVIVVGGTPRVPRAGFAAERLTPLAGMDSMFYAPEVEDVIDPREYANQPDAVKAITQRYTTGLERIIRRHPEQYFWLHRRWKHQPAVRKAKPAAA